MYLHAVFVREISTFSKSTVFAFFFEDRLFVNIDLSDLVFFNVLLILTSTSQWAQKQTAVRYLRLYSLLKNSGNKSHEPCVQFSF